ncbi:FkbM family methyltransferase [Planctomycetes bacterium K23_9]|uniref:2-O-methyltransferase NoeI n=1 Tax=Stieleria marina TaxID=1930275 RepID=A0A517NQM4_9BACT|nr:2-O-methyltransferase NoeI [Planctomycetes bacterium K23_9]
MSTYDIKAYVRGMVQRSPLGRTPLGGKHRPDHSASLLNKYGIDVVFDVGANNGQYGRQMTSMGWRRPLVSFEPLSSAFRKLQSNARPFPNWQAVNVGLGATDGQADINIAGNSQSSSFREITSAHTDAAPTSKTIGTETVEIRKLDSIIDQYSKPDDRCFLKLDVQGFEKDVLEGALNSMDRVVGLQAEMALTPLYDGETLFPEMVEYLESLGYCMMCVGGVFADARTGQFVQLEGVFYKQSEVGQLKRVA